MKAILEKLIEGQHLTQVEMHDVIEKCINQELTDPQIASFLALMRMKGETVEELYAAATTLKGHAKLLNIDEDLVDIVGTGGDGHSTFNISTASCFVASAAGAKVAKHGSVSVSSKSGSADLFESAGIKLNLSLEGIKACLKDCGLAFLFAPNFHPAMKAVRRARQALQIRTLFNLLGPILNPASASYQVVGVFDRKWQQPVAEVLAKLGSKHALVVHSRDGLDEFSISDVTDVVEYKDGHYETWSLDPKNYGMACPSLEPLKVNSPEESLQMILGVLSGQAGPARNIVVLNAAAALYCSAICSSIEDGIRKAEEAIDSQKAMQCFKKFKTVTNQAFP